MKTSEGLEGDTDLILWQNSESHPDPNSPWQCNDSISTRLLLCTRHESGAYVINKDYCIYITHRLPKFHFHFKSRKQFLVSKLHKKDQANLEDEGDSQMECFLGAEAIVMVYLPHRKFIFTRYFNITQPWVAPLKQK